ncbi:MAG TPA: hypothetical protein VNW29_02205 [Candidatus Sulfotelmatobacter sp.]|jgi:hypothetical protein|nr:hypothetical protein [Candidatus Sulfotelmatobacter sp.]
MVTRQHVSLHMNKIRKTAFLIGTTLSLFFFFPHTFAYAATGINKTINFQSKVVNTDGTNVADGTYDFVFTIYNGAGSAATNLFSESWTSAALWSSTMTTSPAAAGESLVYVSNTNVSSLKIGQILTNTTKGESVVITSVNTGTNTLGISPTAQAWATSDTITNKIYVKNGIFRVAINSLNQNISGVDFNTDTLFLGVNFNADGEAKPRMQMAAAPYALNADKINGINFSGTSGNTYSFPATNNGVVLTSNAPTQTITAIQTSGTVLGVTDATTQTGAETGLAIALSGTGAFDQTGLSFNLSNATGTNLNDIVGTGATWKVAKTGAVTLTPSTNTAGITVTGTNISSANLLTLNSSNTSGVQLNQAYTGAISLAGAITGHTIDLSTNLTATNQSATGLNIILPGAIALSNNTTQNYKGLVLTAGGSLTQTGAATNTFNGLDITSPTLISNTNASAIATGNGIKIVTGNLTQTTGTVTQNGLNIDMSGTTITTGGTLTGLRILPPTTAQAAGTTNAIFLGTSTNAVANTGDSATISVGNIASTATQNFSTLNIQNGGTGYLDVELIRGMIDFQNMNTLSDDFTGKAIDANKWTPTAVGTGTCQLLAGGLNGMVRMATLTAAAGNGCKFTSQTTMSNGIFQAGNNPIFETKWRITTATTDYRMFAGFANALTANSDTNTSVHAYLFKRAADTTFQCGTSGGTETVTNTGVTITQNKLYRLRVEVRSGTTPEVICTVDDGTTVTKTVVTTNQPTTATAEDVLVDLQTSDAVNAETADMDYLRAWQDDPQPGVTVTNPNQLTQNSSESLPSPTPIDVSSTLSPAPTDIATMSALNVKGHSIFDGLVTVTSQLLAHNFIVNGIADFFDSVIFHKNVTFLVKPTFPNDLGGNAIIKKGDVSVAIHFTNDFEQIPIINTTIVDTVAETQNQTANSILTQAYTFIVIKRTKHGFIIQLNKPASSDITFSWSALSIKDPNTTQSDGNNNSIPSDSPTIDITPLLPSVTINPSKIIPESLTTSSSATIFQN